MSAVVLDTHALVWMVSADSQLGRKSRAAINAAARTGEAYVSAITPWEIAMLVAKGRLAFTQDAKNWLDTALTLPGIRLEALSVDIAVASSRLPGEPHGDPADRIIAATARALNATLVTADARLLAYGRAGHLLTQDAAK